MEQEKLEHKTKLMKVHQDFLEFVYFNQYNSFDDRDEIYPCLDRIKEYDMDGNWEWMYITTGK